MERSGGSLAWAFSPPGRVVTACDADAGEDLGDVELRAIGTYVEPLGDLAVRQPFAQKLEHLVLARRKGVGIRRAASSAHGSSLT